VQERRYAKSYEDLARCLGIRYQTVLGYSKMPGWPQIHSNGKARYDIEKCRKFISERKSAHNFGGNGCNGRDGADGYNLSERERSIIDKNKVAAERTQLAIERERFELAVRMGEFFPKSVVLRAFERSHAMARGEIDRVIEAELPPRLDMVPALEAKKILRKAFDQLFAGIPTAYANSNGG
jgi:hypothetical protein